MTAERINPPELSPPTGFSHAVVATGSRLVFLAGQTALDADGKVVGESCRSSSRRRSTTSSPPWRPPVALRPTSPASPSTPPISPPTVPTP